MAKGRTRDACCTVRCDAMELVIANLGKICHVTRRKINENRKKPILRPVSCRVSRSLFFNGKKEKSKETGETDDGDGSIRH